MVIMQKYLIIWSTIKVSWIWRCSHNGSGIWLLIAPVSVHCFSITFLIKMADVNVGYLKVKMDLLKRWHPKECKEKNPTCVCGYFRQFCHSGHCLASLGRAS